MCEALAGCGGRAPSQSATGWGHKRFLKKKGDWCFGKNNLHNVCPRSLHQLEGCLHPPKHPPEKFVVSASCSVLK